MKSLLLSCAALALILPLSAHAFQGKERCSNPDQCAWSMMKEQCEHPKMMEKIDTDHNGVISAAEADAGAENHFKMMDADGDGTLTEAEFEKAPRPDGMKARFPERQEQMRDKRFMMMDADGNGSVTKAEFMAGAHKRHQKMDANNDGAITKEEMEAGREKMREERWERREERQDRGGWRGWMPQSRSDQTPRNLNE